MQGRPGSNRLTRGGRLGSRGTSPRLSAWRAVVWRVPAAKEGKRPRPAGGGVPRPRRTSRAPPLVIQKKRGRGLKVFSRGGRGARGGAGSPLQNTPGGR